MTRGKTPSPAASLHEQHPPGGLVRTGLQPVEIGSAGEPAGVGEAGLSRRELPGQPRDRDPLHPAPVQGYDVAGGVNPVSGIAERAHHVAQADGARAQEGPRPRRSISVPAK